MERVDGTPPEQYNQKKNVCGPGAIEAARRLCGSDNMVSWATRGQQVLVSTLAIVSVLFHALILAIHTASSFLALPHIAAADPDAIVICRAGHTAAAPATPIPDKAPAPKTSCPICLGLAAMELAVLGEPIILAAPASHGVVLPDDRATFVLDHRPLELFSRGPPLLA